MVFEEDRSLASRLQRNLPELNLILQQKGELGLFPLFILSFISGGGKKTQQNNWTVKNPAVIQFSHDPACVWGSVLYYSSDTIVFPPWSPKTQKWPCSWVCVRVVAVLGCMAGGSWEHIWLCWHWKGRPAWSLASPVAKQRVNQPGACLAVWQSGILCVL